MHKVVLITGAAQRIGKETAKVFAEDNWNVIIHFNSSFEAASELAAELNTKRSGSACIIQADLDIDADVERLILESKEAYGRMDALINNASSFYSTPLPNISYEDWDKLIGSNLKGPLFLTKGLAPMLEEAKGSVINITDINIDKGLPGFSIYPLKERIAAITKVLAKELAPNIRVNAVSPGTINTPGKSWSEEELAKIVSKIPLTKSK